MNVENILRVADAIEKRSIKGLGFNMENWIDEALPDVAGHPCGTAACVAGWAYVLKTGPTHVDNEDHVEVVARRYLDLDGSQAWALFTPGDADKWHEITDKQAVRTLRHLAATGEIRWDLSETTP